jgi:hypothetical protein
VFVEELLELVDCPDCVDEEELLLDVPPRVES